MISGGWWRRQWLLWGLRCLWGRVTSGHIYGKIEEMGQDRIIVSHSGLGGMGRLFH
jgi:hypothetical protein